MSEVSSSKERVLAAFDQFVTSYTESWGRIYGQDRIKAFCWDTAQLRLKIEKELSDETNCSRCGRPLESHCAVCGPNSGSGCPMCGKSTEAVRVKGCHTIGCSFAARHAVKAGESQCGD